MNGFCDINRNYEYGEDISNFRNITEYERT